MKSVPFKHSKGYRNKRAILPADIPEGAIINNQSERQKKELKRQYSFVLLLGLGVKAGCEIQGLYSCNKNALANLQVCNFVFDKNSLRHLDANNSMLCDIALLSIPQIEKAGRVQQERRQGG